MNQCYKCAVEIKPDWKKCYNCGELLLCPQCDSNLTGRWKVYPNCKVDLDFGRISKMRAIGYFLGIGIIMPIIFIIIGLIFLGADIFSFYQFSFSELFSDFSGSNFPFIIWTLFYSFMFIIGGTECLIYGINRFREHGIFFFITAIFGIVSLLIIRIFGIFTIGMIIIMLIYIFGLFDILRIFNKIKKNRPIYLKELQIKKEESKVIVSEAKKRLFGMIKGEGKVNLDFASEIINMDQNTIRGLIYDLIAEDKVEGTFQENIFLITSDVNTFIDDLLNKYDDWEREKEGKKI
ncbi:MAG: hypothetical protein ACFFC3_10600 [Candidatus Odinarchaeota archaeon]